MVITIIYFRDSGRGIPAGICDYLNEGKMPEGEVHVMGLRIVRQIVKAHGGHIQAEMDGHRICVELGRNPHTILICK